ncbi:MAG: aspartoacylase [Cyanobacteriota bacterium]|jgi:aspartoacylase
MAGGEKQGSLRVLVVGGTHGNERNAVRLLEHWRGAPDSLERRGLEVVLAPGNPAAIAAGRRYVDRDLNRSFLPELVDDPHHQELEARRARELLGAWGPEGATPCQVALDLHSTTAAMGNSLVVYGRRPADLALAAGVQGRLGLPVYLHEGDPAQRGYLAERWPCGLVIEVGPVPQGVVTAAICHQTQLALETALAVLADAREGVARLPSQLVVHRHLRSLDVPRDPDGQPTALVHPRRQDRDWRPLRAGDPLFLEADGATRGWEPLPGDPPVVWPVFINEAAYEEKGIALSLTQREAWPVAKEWEASLRVLVDPQGKTYLTEAKSG